MIPEFQKQCGLVELVVVLKECPFIPHSPLTHYVK